MIKRGKLRADKVKYDDGVGCSIWYPMGDDDDSGICFDFSEEDSLDLIWLVKKLRAEDAQVPDVLDYEEQDNRSFYRKYLKHLHIGLIITPFNWEFKKHEFIGWYKFGPFEIRF